VRPCCSTMLKTLMSPRPTRDTRALLLAGNRRSVSVPLKEPTGNGESWRIRWVNAYCPWDFTAKKLPSAALASRSIVIPLVRTADDERGNHDPAKKDHRLCDWRQLLDEIWALALMLLPKAEAI
jgi:hypothetical protein